MSFAWGPVVGGAIGALGSYLGSRSTNQYSAQQAAANNAFNEQMSNTAHTREVADLKNAGLNPILSATGGSGAVSPVAQSWQVQNSLGAAISSANQGFMSGISGMEMQPSKEDELKQRIENLKEEKRLKKAEADVAERASQKITEGADTVDNLTGFAGEQARSVAQWATDKKDSVIKKFTDSNSAADVVRGREGTPLEAVQNWVSEKVRGIEDKLHSAKQYNDDEYKNSPERKQRLQEIKRRLRNNSR